MALPLFSGSNPHSPLQSSPKQKLDEQFFKEFSRAVALVQADTLRRIASQRSHYNPNQPRVPIGNHDGGQWTNTGRGDGRPAHAEVRESSPPSLLRQVLSDESPDVPRVWAQYAQAGIGHNSQNPAVERTKQILTDILMVVNRRVATHARSNPISAQLYGINVHTEFANEVRAQNLPGIGRDGVEQSFNSFNEIVRYGLDGSIRTDVILRDRSGQIIAIFDVKTGKATMAPATERKYRRHTDVGPDVPIIILHAVRGAGLW